MNKYFGIILLTIAMFLLALFLEGLRIGLEIDNVVMVSLALIIGIDLSTFFILDITSKEHYMWRV